MNFESGLLKINGWQGGEAKANALRIHLLSFGRNEIWISSAISAVPSVSIARSAVCLALSCLRYFSKGRLSAHHLPGNHDEHPCRVPVHLQFPFLSRICGKQHVALESTIKKDALSESSVTSITTRRIAGSFRYRSTSVRLLEGTQKLNCSSDVKKTSGGWSGGFSI